MLCRQPCTTVRCTRRCSSARSRLGSARCTASTTSVAAHRPRVVPDAPRAPLVVSKPLLVVDVQRGFINDFTRHIPGRIKRLVETGEFEPLLFTRFINSPDSPYQR